jgi:hypothetical protein
MVLDAENVITPLSALSAVSIAFTTPTKKSAVSPDKMNALNE